MLMFFQAKSMKRCPSLLNDTQQIVEDMNLLYIRQISKKLQVHSIMEMMMMFCFQLCIWILVSSHFNTTHIN